jgi:hypothetical protein
MRIANVIIEQIIRSELGLFKKKTKQRKNFGTL